MRFPFEVRFEEIQSDPEPYVDAVFGSLQSEFMVMPRGKGFVEFSTFEAGYEALKRATRSFQDVTPETVTSAVLTARWHCSSCAVSWALRLRSGPLTPRITPA